MQDNIFLLSEGWLMALRVFRITDYKFHAKYQNSRPQKKSLLEDRTTYELYHIPSSYQVLKKSVHYGTVIPSINFFHIFPGKLLVISKKVYGT